LLLSLAGLVSELYTILILAGRVSGKEKEMKKVKLNKSELETRVRTVELHIEALYKLFESHASSQFQHRYQDPTFPKPDPIKGWIVT
jgi:hypothetical protein